MKKLLLLLMTTTLSVWMMSCSDNFDSIDEIVSVEMESTTFRTVDEAITIALDASNFVSNSSRASRTIDLNSVKLIKSSSRSIDPLFYIVNYTDSMGYAFISADKGAEAVLAVTESGHFEDVESSDNPAMGMIYNNAIDYLSGFPGGEPILPPTPQMLEIEFDTIANYDEPKRINVNWWPGGACGQFCSNFSCGCGPLAVIMSFCYLQAPSSITLTTENNTTLNLDWSSLQYCDDMWYQPQELGYLGKELADRMNANFNAYLQTGVNFGNCHDVTASILPGRVSAIYTGLPNPHLLIPNNGVIIMGSEESDGTGDHTNHIYIIDGFKYLYVDVYVYKVDVMNNLPLPSTRVLIRQYVDTYYYYHINWGWGGDDNGYFSKNLIAPREAVSYDGTTYPGNNYHYTIHHYFRIQ